MTPATALHVDVSLLENDILDMDAFRGERNDDDEDGILGDAAEE